MKVVLLHVALLVLGFGELLSDYGVEALWNAFVFVTSRNYQDVRLTTEDDYIASRQIFKGMAIKTATLACVRSCALVRNCEAFSLYQNEDTYVCEMVSDNYCLDRGSTVIVSQKGSYVWDKISNGPIQSCFDQKFKNVTNIPCESTRPGCLGNWPNCTNCTRTCVDCFKRYYPYKGYKNCTLWPDGDGPSSVPINGRCLDDLTVVVKRNFSASTGQLTLDYWMPFQDINRLCQLKVYWIVWFSFFTAAEVRYYARYKNIYIDSNGSFVNMSSSSVYSVPHGDFFKLTSSTPRDLKFVTVTDDIYGCGSFWLVDAKNATYCPGGSIKMFGTPKVNGSKVLQTGMRYNGVQYYGVEIALSKHW